MTQEDRELLLNYLTMALPYGVKCNIGLEFPLKLQRISVDMLDGILLDFFLTDINYQVYLSEVKPYLRPMSNMTEEEDKEYGLLCFDVSYYDKDTPKCSFKLIKWLLEKHFDFLELIPKGLALEAPEGMYNFKKTRNIKY